MQFVIEPIYSMFMWMFFNLNFVWLQDKWRNLLRASMAQPSEEREVIVSCISYFFICFAMMYHQNNDKRTGKHFLLGYQHRLFDSSFAGWLATLVMIARALCYV